MAGGLLQKASLLPGRHLNIYLRSQLQRKNSVSGYVFKTERLHSGDPPKNLQPGHRTGFKTVGRKPDSPAGR